MFNKLKQIKDMRSQAKEMQNQLAQEIVDYEKGGIKIKINGNMEVLDVKIEDKSDSNLDEKIKDAFNEAVKKSQKQMAKKMQEMGQMPGLGDMLK